MESAYLEGFMSAILSRQVLLVPANLPMLDAMVMEDWASLSRLLGGADMAESWMHFPEAMAWMRDYLLEHPDELGWWSYLVVHQADFRLIGTCGYKGVPTPEGTVELGYEIAPAYQGRGLATEVAHALVGHAFRAEAVNAILAHTLAEDNASVAVLRKLGFEWVKDIHDPEDGHIWQWRLSRLAYHSTTTPA